MKDRHFSLFITLGNFFAFREVFDVNRVLLAIGEPNISKILRNNLNEHHEHFTVEQQEVLHHKYFDEIIGTAPPDIIIVHDTHLESDKGSKQESELEWLRFAESLRERFNDQVRLVFICEREKGDPFLHELLNRNVLDIFHTRSIPIATLIEQLKERPRYSNAAKFKVDRPYFNNAQVNASVQDETDGHVEEEEPEEKEEKPTNVIQKVVEKKVVNKIVNKQVVKRNYKVNVTQNVDRVVGVPIEKKLVLIGSPFSRSGSSFVSHLLASVLADIGIGATYIESPFSPAYTYDRYSGHSKIDFYRSSFYQHTKEIDPKKPSVFHWELDGINMVVKHPSDEPVYTEKEISFETFVKVLMNAQTPVVILDVGKDLNKEVYQDIYDMANQMYMVMEPDIANIQYLIESNEHSPSVYRKVMEDEKCKLIANRFDKSLQKNDIIKDLYDKPLTASIPTFPSKEVTESQINGEFLIKNKALQDEIDESINPLLKELLPEEFLKKKSKEGSWIKNLFSRSVSIESN